MKPANPTAAFPFAWNVFPYRPATFKINGAIKVAEGVDPAVVLKDVTRVIRGMFNMERMSFDETVRVVEIEAKLRSLASVTSVTVTALWVPVRSGPTLNSVLAPDGPQLEPPVGAEILVISNDADAIDFVCS